MIRKCYGLIGEKLYYSISPLIHTMVMKKIDINATYDLLEISRKDFKNDIRKIIENYSGLNLTIPYKISTISFIDEISDEAEEIGSINTIVHRNGKTIGYNTDYCGFLYMMKKKNIDFKDRIVYILGTGGESKTIYAYLKKKCTKKIYFVSRTKFDVKKNIIPYSSLNNIPSKSIIINCTPCGMYPDISSCPVSSATIKKFEAVIDLIYSPSKTLLIKEAEKYGIKTCNGLYTLIVQAVKSEELWNNKKIDDSIIEEIYNMI